MAEVGRKWSKNETRKLKEVFGQKWVSVVGGLEVEDDKTFRWWFSRKTAT